MTTDDLSVLTKNQSDIEGEVTITREEARAIKAMCENYMVMEDTYKYALGGENWADIDNLRTKMKTFLVNNQ